MVYVIGKYNLYTSCKPVDHQQKYTYTLKNITAISCI